MMLDNVLGCCHGLVHRAGCPYRGDTPVGMEVKQMASNSEIVSALRTLIENPIKSVPEAEYTAACRVLVEAKLGDHVADVQDAAAEICAWKKQYERARAKGRTGKIY